MDSPFDYNGPVTGQRFIDRKEDCALLGSLLGECKNIAIWEPSGTGKRSLIQQTIVTQKAKGLKIQTAELSALDIRTIEAFAKRLGDTVIRMCASIPDEYEEIVGKYLVGTHFTFDRISFSNDDEILSLNGEMRDEDLMEVLKLPYRLASENQSLMYVVIDEFQNLDLTEDGDKLFSMMEKAMDEMLGMSGSFAYIFIGSQVNAMNGIFLKRHRFWHLYERVRVSDLDEKDIVEHVVKGFLSSGKVIDRGLISGACRLFKCHPFYINFFFSICDSLSKGYITEPVLLEALESMMSIYKGRFVAMMGDLTTFQVNLLRAIVDGCEKFSTAEVIRKYSLNSSANVRRLKDALMKKEIITFEEPQETPKFLDPLFEYWLRNRYFRIL